MRRRKRKATQPTPRRYNQRRSQRKRECKTQPFLFFLLDAFFCFVHTTSERRCAHHFSFPPSMRARSPFFLLGYYTRKTRPPQKNTTIEINPPQKVQRTHLFRRDSCPPHTTTKTPKRGMRCGFAFPLFSSLIYGSSSSSSSLPSCSALGPVWFHPPHTKPSLKYSTFCFQGTFPSPLSQTFLSSLRHHLCPFVLGIPFRVLFVLRYCMQKNA